MATYLSALGQTKGSMVSVNLVANTDLRTPEEFRRLVVKEDGVVVRLGEIAHVQLGAENYEQDSGSTANLRRSWASGCCRGPIRSTSSPKCARRFRRSARSCRPA